MPSLAIDINWAALGQVALVTILATGVIAALMSLSNWALSPGDDGAAVSTTRQVLGYALLGVQGIIILVGLYLMIPYFR
jgi:hypothetical protein